MSKPMRQMDKALMAGAIGAGVLANIYAGKKIAKPLSAPKTMSRGPGKPPVRAQPPAKPGKAFRASSPRYSAAPVAYSNTQVTTLPSIRGSSSAGVRCCRISHRELVNPSLSSATSYTIQNTFPINPGLSSVFPWLSIQAGQWEQYRFRRLSFEFITRVGTGTQGSVILSPNYDPSDASPTTEVAAADNQGAVEDVVWKDLTLHLRVADMHALGPRKFVRQGPVAGDIKTFDVAKVFVATTDATGATPVGKLWVNYDVDFFVPQNVATSTQVAQSTSFATNSVGNLTALTQATNTILSLVQLNPPLYDATGFFTANSGSSMGTGVIIPPRGVFRIRANVAFANTSLPSSSNYTLIQQMNSVNQGTVVDDNGSADAVSLVSDAVFAFNGITDTWNLLGFAQTSSGSSSYRVLTVTVDLA